MSKSSSVNSGKRFSYTDVLKNLLPWKGDPFREILRKIVFLIAVIVFGVCAYLIFDYFYENYKNNKLYAEIQKDIPILSDMIENNGQDTHSSDEMLSYMEGLVEKNPDIVGYIQIPDKNGDCRDTGVDYPIVQKKNADEKDFYLDHNLYGEEARAGAIYLDWRNTLEARERSGNLIIYGHQMKDGSMFGKLSNYYENSYFYEEHPCIELSSRYEVSTYKIFAFYYADGGEYDYDFMFNSAIDFGSEQDFYDYINQIKRRSLILNEVDMQYGDELLTLSTCVTGYYRDARFVVAARKLRPGEDKYSGTENNATNPNPYMPLEWYRANGGGIDYEDTNFVPYG